MINMKIEHADKVTILLAALSERYNSLHLIRARVESIGTWIIGLSLGAGGWLLQSTHALTCADRSVLIIGVLLGLAVLRYFYLADLRTGFKAQQRVAARLEDALGLYEDALFDAHASPIYPIGWKNAGAKESEGKFFQSTYLMIYLSAIFLTISILAAGSI
ncbi:MAG TPA: hypothetical protein VGT78_01225 [Rhizomicrobium sp.]|nr:hypothetical protein [Rhizomicrobium sp.]